MTDYPRDPDRTDITDETAETPPVSGEAEYAPSAVSDETLDRIANATVYDADGEKVGSVGRIYLRDETGKPSWITVKSGFFGLRESLVPMRDVDTGGEDLRVPYTKDVIKGAPSVDADDHLSPAEEEELQSYYRGHGWQGHEEPVAAVPMVGDPEEAMAAVEHEEARRAGTDRPEERDHVLEEHAPRPDDRPADLSRTEDDALTDRDEPVREEPVVRDEPIVRDEPRDESVADEDRGGDRVGRMGPGEALAAGSAGVAGAGLGGTEYADDPDRDRAHTDEVDRAVVSDRDDARDDTRDLDDRDRGELHDRDDDADRVVRNDDVDRIDERDPGDEHAGATAVGSDVVVDDGDSVMDERERVIANDPVSALDDPNRTKKREERFDRMEERTEQLKDTSVTDAILEGSSGVGGLGVEGTDHSEGNRDVAGVDRDADRSDHEVVQADTGEERAEHEVVRGDHDEERPDHEVTRADRDESADRDVAGTDHHAATTSGDVAGSDRQDEFSRFSRSESGLDDVRDGGYGIGSAAPLGDGRQPLGHPIRAWEDTKSFRSGPAVGVEREPDVWFLDDNAAYNAGFHPAD